MCNKTNLPILTIVHNEGSPYIGNSKQTRVSQLKRYRPPPSRVGAQSTVGYDLRKAAEMRALGWK